MTDYISREAAKKAVVEAVGKGHSPFNAIVMLPVADVVPVVRGKWVDDKGNLVPWDELNKACPRGSASCSVCGEWLTASDEYPVIGNFCPNCGADMREES